MASSRFDAELSRWDTHSAKWDLLAAHLGKGAVSLSVADMEFRTAPAVQEAVEDAVKQASFGYTEVFEDFRQAAAGWQRRRHGFDVDAGDVVFFPRIVQCISALVNLVLPKTFGRAPVVVAVEPAYGPILEVVRLSGSELRLVSLVMTKGQATIDFKALESAMDGADLLIWCNPHNPTGRVWDRLELEHVAQLARHHSVMVASDDIHADFCRPGRTRYRALASVAPDLWEAGQIIQCASPGKTFTIAGLEVAAILARGPIKAELEWAKRCMGLHNPNYFAVPAAIAAWNQGDGWVDDLCAYLDENVRVCVNKVKELLPHAIVTDPEGTYLVWVDLRTYGAGFETIQAAEGESGVAVSHGLDFGTQYEGFVRLNVALPRQILLDAVNSWSQAMAAIAARQ